MTEPSGARISGLQELERCRGAAFFLVYAMLAMAGCTGASTGEPDAGGPPPGDYDGGFLAPGWQEGPRCDASLQELPVSGAASWQPMVSLWGSYIVYHKSGPTTLGDDVFLYDLERCRETQLTYREGHQAAASIGDGQVLFHDYTSPIRWYSEEWVSRLVSFDLTTQRFSMLTSTGKLFSPQHSGRFVLYHRAYPSAQCCDRIDYALTLWDRENEVYETLSEGYMYPGGAFLSANHVAWVEWEETGGIPTYSGIGHLDLETGASTSVASSPTALALAEDWLLWTDERSGVSNVYARHLPSGQESPLTSDGYVHRHPTARGSIACWSTDRYAGGVPDHWDLLLHDLETGVQRRLTAESTPGVPRALVHGRWAIFTRGEIDAPHVWFALHLPTAGLMDANGRLIQDEGQ